MFEKWWADVPKREKQGLIVLVFIVLGVLVFLTGNAVGQALGGIL